MIEFRFNRFCQRETVLARVLLVDHEPGFAGGSVIRFQPSAPLVALGKV
jgi:hypothetical protein